MSINFIFFLGNIFRILTLKEFLVNTDISCYSPFISFLCHIVIYAFILLDQLFIANGIHRIPIKTGIVISRYGDQINFPKTLKVLVLKISVELPTNGIKSTINLAPCLIPLGTRLFFLIRTLYKLFLLCICRTSSAFLYIQKQ